MLKEIAIENLKFNPFEVIGEEWMLIAAGKIEKHNMMTASWGGMGVLWGKNVATVYIRPTRYTLEFVENEDFFSLCFFGKNKKIHEVCGSKSGRDIDKTKAANLTPATDGNGLYFEEAELVFICKKVYFDDLKIANFLDKSVEKFYPIKDYHKVFIGEIVKVLKSESRE
ncbi:MAG TPA: flavin reductase family protein [Clostridia bacterium]|nr:flavin reductase family protein [Clostridia bacterium]